MPLDPRLIDDLARRLAGSVPEGVSALRRDLEQNFKGVLQGGLAKFDLVTREEFDVQAAVLRRTREKLAALEQRLAALEGDKQGIAILVIGSYLSPYVRKVLACLDLKGLAYEIDPIVPFMGDDRFSALSPLRRVPVLVDDRVTLADSSVICQYLEDRYPLPRLYPEDVADRARARWLEEYADSRMGDVFIWRLFNLAAIEPAVWGTPRDLDAIAGVVRDDVPPVLDYLESQAPREGFLFGEPGIADIAIGVFLRNAALARYRVDPLRWPATASYVDRVLAQECFARLVPFEAIMMRTPIPAQRAALAAAGAPLSTTTVGGDTPRRGVMRT